MTLIFGKLTASFVAFATIAKSIQGDPTNPVYLQQLAEAKRSLKHDAAMDALWLTLIGIGMLITTCTFQRSDSSQSPPILILPWCLLPLTDFYVRSAQSHSN